MTPLHRAEYHKMWQDDLHGRVQKVGLAVNAVKHKQVDACIDTDDGAIDVDYYSCQDHAESPSYCGQTVSDDTDFTLDAMCCACGGGKVMKHGSSEEL